MAAKELVRACDGQLHDGLAEQIVGLIGRGKMGDAARLVDLLEEPMRSKARARLGFQEQASDEGEENGGDYGASGGA